jgi:uncharacterized HAD superfamily protein
VKKIVIVDIDGILTDYPHCFLKWVKQHKKKTYASIPSMKKAISLSEYEVIKEEYRNSGIKRYLPVNQSVLEVLKTCKRNGYIIWIVTTRPKREPVVSDTLIWFENKLIPYDEIFFVTDKKEFIKQVIRTNSIYIIIDDEMDKLVN